MSTPLTAQCVTAQAVKIMIKPDEEPADPLADFPGHVPDRTNFEGDYVQENYGEFLTRLEPRIVRKTGPGQWESANTRAPGEATAHGVRMKLLERARDREEEKKAGVHRHR